MNVDRRLRVSSVPLATHLFGGGTRNPEPIGVRCTLNDFEYRIPKLTTDLIDICNSIFRYVYSNNIEDLLK